MKRRLLTVSLLLPMIFSSISIARPLKNPSPGIADQRKISQIVLEQGLQDSTPSPANNCSTYVLSNLKVLFFSAKNLPNQFTPQLSGVHVVIETEKEIEQNIQDNKKHCWIKLGEMAVSGKEVAVTFTKKIETQFHHQGVRYVFEETLRYSLVKAKGKWICKLKKRSELEN